MKLDNVYQASLKNENRDVLVYEKNGKYIDLKSKNIKYEKDNLDNFIPLSRMLGFSQNMLINNIIPLYHSMIHQMIPIDKLYIGDISMIHNFSMSQNETRINIDLDMNVVKRDHIFIKRDQGYFDIEDYILYSNYNIKIGDLRVVNLEKLTDILKIDVDKSRMDRQKIINLYRRK